MTLTDDQLKMLTADVLEIANRAAEVAKLAVEVNTCLKRAAELTAQSSSLGAHQVAAAVRVLEALEVVAKS